MILAAGYGTRLAPLSDRLPKPLLPVGGVPLLDHALAACRRAGVGAIAVNTHHLGGLIAEHLASRSDADHISVFHENDILGTGGALDGARQVLQRADAFLLHNGDVLCDADLAALADEHERTGVLATLLLVDWPPVNSVTLAADGQVLAIAGLPAAANLGAAARRLTYAGVALFATRLLDDIPSGPSSLVTHLARAIEREPGCVRGWAPDGITWSDVGTLGRYLAAQPPSGAEPSESSLRLTRLTGHGSDRRFWRLKHDGWSAVAMASPEDDQEFDRFVAISRFLGDAALQPAALLAVDQEGRAALMEDLGDTRLHDLATSAPRGAAEVDAAYRCAVDWLLDLQCATAQARRDCPAAVDRKLDRAGLRWESEYFHLRFLNGHLELPEDSISDLEPEFGRLADVVAEQPQVLIHRDFQSQNLMWDGGLLRPVDTQGMRLGPLAYDLASLIWDPYVEVPNAIRTRLVDRFAAGARDRGLVPPGTGDDEIRAMTLAAGLQRIMQALGAFGYLGRVKNKSGFLVHVPAGLDRLRRILDEVASLRSDASLSAARRLPPEMPRLAVLIGTSGGSP